MEELTDLELINKVQAGDHLSFAALTERHYMTVYRYAFKWCRSQEDAEEITQEVFIKLVHKIKLFDKRSLFTTWLYTITVNCARDYARKNRKWRQNKLSEPPEDVLVASPNPGPENNVIARSILKAVENLPDKLKEAMLLVYAEGLNHKEAAQVIKCAETTVSWRIFQAKRKLRKVLS
jgi:RNA polymerase sigma-70 factor (ECF subfamily)